MLKLKSKLLILLSTLGLSFSLWAADPYWKEGVDDQELEITVYHSPTCGCCYAWMDHLREHNFIVKERMVQNVSPIKQELGLPPQAASCHTALMGDKIIKGHVPAQDIKKVLNNADIKALTVPGMVSGSPGMDTEGAPKDPFKVYAIHHDGEVDVYKTYEGY